MKRLIACCLLVIVLGVPESWAQQVSIKGSNTFGEDLGPALIEGFKKMRPDIEIDLVSISSGFGINALLEGKCDIASSSRALNEDEIRLVKSRRLRIENHPVGYYGIAVVVQPNHPVKALNDQQVEQIFTGEIVNWQDLGGPDRPIHLYIADADAGTHLGFRELAMSNRDYAEGAIEHVNYHDLGKAVANDPSGIGYVSLSVMREIGLHGVLINGIHPSSIAVIEGLYPYARLVRLITRRGQTSSEARAFVRFVQSQDGQNIVERTGFVPRMTSPIQYSGIDF
ncbi:MAG: phosphate ABC transporter substrate-binding protein [Kiritimatiellia bacterium]|jgi:phosphate transport system substrate-binding protein